MRILTQKYPRKIVIVLGVLLTFVFFASYAIADLTEQTKVEALFDKYINAINCGDIDTQMRLAIDVRQSPEETRKLYTQLLKQDDSIPVSYTINKMTKEGEYILVDTTLIMKDGHSEDGTVKIIDHEGEWKFYVG